MQNSLQVDENTNIKYWISHENQSPTIIMIHGFTGSHEGFQYIIPKLANFKIITPDLPGFGESDPAQGDWTIESIADLANQFVAKLGLTERPIILGHSMGGLVVSSMVSQAPDLFAQQVILISPVPTPIRNNEMRRAGAVLGALQYRLGQKLPKKIGEKLVKSKKITKSTTRLLMTTKDKDLRKEIHSHHLRNNEFISSIEFYDSLYRDINRHGAIDHKNELKKRDVLLIVGDKDTVTPLKEEQKLAQAIKPRKFVTIHGVGHLSHYERPDEIAEAIQEFLR